MLLDFTASNPTGRRNSSESPLTTDQGTANAIGLSGEEVVAHDLGIPRNEQVNQRQCICKDESNAPPASECRTCFVYISSITSYRRPDFVAPNFIAEVKNVKRLLYSGREVEQINDYVTAAIALKRPLWLYVRVDTYVEPPFKDLVKSTGGRVVRYLTVPGHVDPIDSAARVVLFVALVMMILIALMELSIILFFGGQPIVGVPSPGKPAQKPPKDPKVPIKITFDKLDTAETFKNKVADTMRRKIDEDDIRSDL
jgi:hypothetical protein